MKKLILYSVLLTALLFAACKKNTDKPSSPVLQGKWGIVNEAVLDVENGTTVYTDNYTGVAADYIDFRSDNKVYSLVDGGMDTSAYKMLSNNRVLIDIDTLDILSLTASAANLHSKVYTGVNSYEELTVNLKR